MQLQKTTLVDEFQEEENQNKREEKNSRHLDEIEFHVDSDPDVKTIHFSGTRRECKGNRNKELLLTCHRKDMEETTHQNRKGIFYKVGVRETRQPVFV